MARTSGAKPPEESVRHVLVVEDDPDDAATVRLALHGKPGLRMTLVRTAGEALELVRVGTYHAFLLDNRLPDMSGLRLCEALRGQGIRAPVILLSSVQEDVVAERAFRAGADDYVIKDFAYGARLHRLLLDRMGS